VSVAVRPWEVVLSTAPPVGSARNVFEGQVREVLPLGSRVRVTLGIGARGSTPLVAEITPEAQEGLACHEGQRLYASFKATAVTVNTL
jgi:molybdopterin-binding protein